jgi:beta-lactamase regulating signal transducer with metallopeptidase domain
MDLIANAQYGFAPALALALLHSLWQDALLALVAALTLHSLAQRSASLRHAVGMGFLLAMLLAPLVTFLRFWQQPGSEINESLLPVVTAPEIGAVPGVFVQQSGSVASWMALLWLLGVSFMVVRHMGGLRLLGALARRPYQPLPIEWQQRLLVLQGALGIGRTVAVRLAVDVISPFTAHVLRPVIWLPLGLLARLPADQIEALLAHELAHIARLDWLWNALQCGVESLLFFHPGVWWLSRRVRQEREHACDDLAVLACGNAIALAEALAGLERQRQPFPRLLLAADGGTLMKRITRLLSESTGAARWRLPVAALVLVCSTSLLATQLGVTGHKLPSITIHSTTSGVLGPGDTREISATGLDKQRYYFAAVDANGRLRETYKEDGQAKAIDAAARRWIVEVDRLSVPPAPPPPPPAPPPPPDLPIPPMPPAPPPPPPEIADSQVFKSVVRLVASDRNVVARLGSPIVVHPRPVSGSIDIDGDSGDAQLSFVANGPKGVAKLTVNAEMENDTWKLRTVEFAGD